MEQQKEYYAFISYKQDDIKWAKWLANELEHYHLPTTLNGKNLPKNLRPIFRDVDELAAGNLPEQIYHAYAETQPYPTTYTPIPSFHHVGRLLDPPNRYTPQKYAAWLLDTENVTKSVDTDILWQCHQNRYMWQGHQNI